MELKGEQKLLTFAVDGHSAPSAFTDVQEAAYDEVIRRASVYKEEVVVVEAGVGEAFGIVDLLVQSDDGGNVVFSEIWKVSLRGVQRVTCSGWSNYSRRVTFNQSSFLLHRKILETLILEAAGSLKASDKNI